MTNIKSKQNQCAIEKYLIFVILNEVQALSYSCIRMPYPGSADNGDNDDICRH